MTDSEKLETILRHIHLVEGHMLRLSKKLLEEDAEKNKKLAKDLVLRSRLHDHSKLKSPEWEHLWKGDPEFQDALKHHHLYNSHHPEHHGTIHKMSVLDVAEMVCDWLARSNEFGTDIKTWVETKATHRYGFTMTDLVGNWISYFLNHLLVEAFA